MKKLKIGWSSADITALGVIGSRIGLGGSLNERITSKIHDPVQAVVAVFENDSGECAAIVSVDLVSVDDRMMEETRRKIAGIIPDFPVDKLIIAATHTHTAPEYRKPSIYESEPDFISSDAYLDFCSGRIAEAVGKAWRSRMPGGIVRKTGRIAMAINRRIRYKDGSAVMYGKTDTPDFLRIEGGADNGAEYIITYNDAGCLTGVILNLACPAQAEGASGYSSVSADIWGAVRQQWSECPYLLPLCGAAGDVTMRDYVRRERSEHSRKTQKGMDEFAGRIIRESRYIVSTCMPEDIQWEAPLAHITRPMRLPLGKVTEEQYAEAVRYLESVKTGEANQKVTFPMHREMSIIKRYELQQKIDYIDMEFHAIRLGDAALVTNSFELYHDYGMQIKARSPFPQTLIAQLACGTMGYLPTEYAMSGGGYSADPCSGLCLPEGGDILVEKTLEALNELFGQV